MEKKSFKKKLLEARKKISNPKRGGTDAFKKRRYVTLQDLYDETLPALLESGLLLINRKELRECGYCLVTQIVDTESDDFIETVAILNGELKIQDQGSELTYHSRYNLGCLLSIRTDFDDDAESIKNIDVNTAINKKELMELCELLENLPKEEEQKMLSWLQVESVARIPKIKFNAAKKALLKKLEVNGGAR